MATLKVYSREYGVRKVQEKVKFNFLEKTAYGVFVGVILLANVVMLTIKERFIHYEVLNKKMI